jgi:TetR/AcrR family transcriptional regulator, transcriptional repressor for nem operon
MSPNTRERILNMARGLIHARSYADVGVAEICEKAGVKKSSFYHFFPSKRDLTLAILDASFEEIQQRIQKQAFSGDAPPMTRLGQLVEAIIQMQSDLLRENGRVTGCPFGNMAAEQATQDEAIRSKVEQLFRRVARSISMLLQQAMDAKEIDPLDVPATADAMLAYLQGVLLLAKTRNDHGLIARLLPRMLDIRITPDG